MYATIRVYPGKSELAGELRRSRESVESAMSAVPGFKAYYFIDTPDGGGASITVCDDQTGAEASNKVAADWIRANLPDMSIAAPAISAGEVVLAF